MRSSILSRSTHVIDSPTACHHLDPHYTHLVPFHLISSPTHSATMYLVRGIVTAATAPYQMYKDLNPSTLTGAIDVIVVERQAENGDKELVCSPFHVRFGKWQVLLPADKKVRRFPLLGCVVLDGH